MRQHESRCAGRLHAPFLTCLGLAVSLSAGLAQDAQKLAQVNIAQLPLPAPARPAPAPRPGEISRPLFGTGSQLQPGARAPFSSPEHQLQPGARPVEDARRPPDPRPSEAPPRKPAGAGASPK